MRPNLRKIAIGFGAAISVGVMMAAVLAPASAQYHHGKWWHRGYAGLAYEPRNAEDEGERNCLWRRRQPAA
jgi:hypothetical protein